MFVTLALSDIDFIDLERPTPNNSKSSLCAQRWILKLYKYYSPTCRKQISSFVIIGFLLFPWVIVWPSNVPQRMDILILLDTTSFNSCQGMTLDRLGIDIIQSVFSRGQLYTALSNEYTVRCVCDRWINNGNNCIQKISFITICICYVLILSLF